MSTSPQEGSQPTVVLVHGGFADGSGWQGVYDLLKDEYSVRIVQEPNLSHEGDVAATKMITGAQSEPVILVGHSYGGARLYRGLPARRAERGRRYSAAAGRLPVPRPREVPSVIRGRPECR